MMRKFVVPLLVLYLGVVPVCAAQVLTDPTRPPAGIGDGTQAAGVPPYPQVRGLQSVIVAHGHCAAIIDGKTVVLGAKHGNEKLIEVNERGVVLQGEQGRRTLSMFPAVGMKVSDTSKVKAPVACKIGLDMQEKNRLKKPGRRR